MENQNFETTFVADATPEAVFNAINNVRGWWADNIEGDTDQLNETFIYRDKYLTATIKIIELSRYKIIWDILETNNEFFENKSEWDGTKIIFEITAHKDKTQLKFTHAGLTPSFECFTICSNSWDYFINTSLKNLIVTGTGKDISKDDKSYSTSFLVDQSPKAVFDAISNVKKWWSENIDGETDRLNSEFTYRYQDVHIAQMKIVTFIADKKIVWFVKDNHFNFTKDKQEWKGTKIVFEISTEENKTKVVFTHHGLVPEYECYQVCHDAWTHYIQGSLKDLITTGKGKPTPKAEADGAKPTSENKSSGTKSIYHRLLIEAPAETIFEALTTQKGLAGWWTPKTVAQPEVGTISTFTFEPDYTKEIKIIALQPYSLVKWEVLKAFEDWVGTTITFEIQPHAKGSILLFHHDGWKEYTPEFASCTHDWGLFLRSLKLLCETGRGRPYPEFNK